MTRGAWPILLHESYSRSSTYFVIEKGVLTVQKQVRPVFPAHKDKTGPWRTADETGCVVLGNFINFRQQMCDFFVGVIFLTFWWNIPGLCTWWSWDQLHWWWILITVGQACAIGAQSAHKVHKMLTFPTNCQALPRSSHCEMSHFSWLILFSAGCHRTIEGEEEMLHRQQLALCRQIWGFPSYPSFRPREHLGKNTQPRICIRNMWRQLQEKLWARRAASLHNWRQRFCAAMLLFTT